MRAGLEVWNAMRAALVANQALGPREDVVASMRRSGQRCLNAQAISQFVYRAFPESGLKRSQFIISHD